MDFNSNKLDECFDRAIEDGVFSGAQISFGFGKKIYLQKNYGHATYDSASSEIRSDTLFDIASLTKPVATTSLYLELVEQKKISLEDPLKKYLPGYTGDRDITLRDLLAHRSGLAAWAPLYRELGGSKDIADIKRDFLKKIGALTPEAPRQTRRIYSDLGFMLLGFVLEEIHGAKLEAIFAERIAQRLSLSHTFFNPLKNSRFNAEDFAATEDCPWRNQLLQGEVHDDNAWALGGAAGHAGLFSNADDLKKFVDWIWDIAAGESWISPETLGKFIDVPEKLGWDTVTPPHSQAGRYFNAEKSIGHLGFTGCSLWMDFSDQKYLILLTNRVHPSRDNEKIKLFRPMVHDFVFKVF